jgi:hypothetical protein
MIRCRPRMCSATGCPVAEWLAYPLTDYPKFDILQSGPCWLTTVCNSIH